MKINADYDAMGQRISKTVTNKNETNGDKFVTTYYVRDPQGNVLAVYEHKRGESGKGTFTLVEQHLYGASRLGMRKRDLALNGTNASETSATYYELTNHLGNVMAVISDEASTTAEPTVVSLTDYYPYGMTEPGRSWNAGAERYRYGFQGQEKELYMANDVYTTDYRMFDTRVSRWLSVDPYAKGYPDISPYVSVADNPIYFVDIDGLWVAKFRDKNDWKKGVVLVAEKGDNVRTLSIQTGIPYGQLLEKNFAGKDSTLKRNFKKGRIFTSDDLPGIESFTAINKFLEGGTADNTNCARLSLGVNGIESPNYNDDSGYESMSIAVEKSTTENNRTTENAQMGDMVTYQLSLSGFYGSIASSGRLQADYVSKHGKRIPEDQMYALAEIEYKNKIKYDKVGEVSYYADHFSVILLKTADGKGIQQILEKPGENGVQINNWYEENDIFKAQSPSNTHHESPIYHIRNEEK